MPCRWSRRCHADGSAQVNADRLPAPTSSPDVDSWKKVRFQYVRSLRRQTKTMLLLMAMIEIIRHGPVELVYAGKHGFPAPGENDFGLAYTAGYILSYIYICIFMIIWMPLFSWWVPSISSDSEEPGFASRLACILKKINMFLLPACLFSCAVIYHVTIAQAFIYVDDRAVGSRRLPKNTKKNWAARLYMLCGIAGVMVAGHGALCALSVTELARTQKHDLVFLIPFACNIGILFGTKVQMKMEKRTARKAATKIVESVTSEKTPLVEV